jgi:carbonic anhydrase
MSDDKSPASQAEALYHDLLVGNERWVAKILESDPNYFTELAKGQQPRFLWIGCSDSRVPANVITGTSAGDMFVHRNIANVVVHTDSNVMSVVQYAVEHLHVPHIIVCGHYGCGGVAAALSNKDYGLLNDWLCHIKDVARANADELRGKDREAAARRLVELNVAEQVYNLAQTAIIQKAWAKGEYPLELHGWVYDLADGKIRELGVGYRSAESLDDFVRYHFDFE